MAEEEKIDFEAEVQASEDGREELGVDDLSGNFVAHPKVGEESGVMSIKRFVATENVNRKDKEGNSFSVGLRHQNGKEKAYILETDRGDYVLGTWEEVGKYKTMCKNVGKTNGFKINIKHIADGGLATKTVDEIAKLRDITPEEAQKLKQGSLKAKKEKKCYEITLIE